jgi:hypothetical protein
VFRVRNGASLTLEGNGTGVLTIGGGDGSLPNVGIQALIAVHGNLYLRDGVVLQNMERSTFSIIYIWDDGEVTMSGGVIKGMKASTGAAIGVYGGIFTMSGGAITGNTATGNGGGVQVQNNGVFTMSGGAIAGNTAGNGGGVNKSNGTFTMSGGAIAGNTATGNGGGVQVQNDGVFTMSGSAVINANNNVYLASGRTIAIDGALTGSTPVATIRPAVTAVGTQVLTGDVSANYLKFDLDPSVAGSIGNDGKLAPES